MIGTVRMQGIEKSFGDNHVLKQAALAIKPGEVHSLLGENGAGKSTLMNILCGLYQPDAGLVEIDGDGVRIDGPGTARDLGISMVHQHFKLVRSFTVVENVMLTTPGGSWSRRSRLALSDRIAALADDLGFAVDPSARIDQISVAEQQRVEIIKALMNGARILILDEPTAVLTDSESDNLLATIKGLAANGTAVVLITHKLREVLNTADWVTVMRGGETVAAQSPQGMTAADLTELMVGSAPVDETPPAEHTGSVRLELNAVSVRRDDGVMGLNGFDMQVHGGEIYGIAGVGGNGQSELAEVLMGAREPEDGRIVIDDQDIADRTPAQRRRMGLATIPADRYTFGLAGDLSLLDNFGVGGLVNGAYGSFYWVDRGAMQKDAAEAISEFEIHGGGPSTKARLLSGGNAQKLVLSRELSGEPAVLIAHSPTRGLDVRACAAVHRYLREARDQGAAVVLVSEDLDEVLNLADRVGVLNRGRNVGEFARPADRQAIGHLMAGHA